MIVVIGAVVARPDALEDVRSLSCEHVRRSRKEPGCLSHNVSVDAENASRFVFVEHWSDMPSLRAHFALESSRQFVEALRDLIAAPPELKIYEVSEVRPG